MCASTAVPVSRSRGAEERAGLGMRFLDPDPFFTAATKRGRTLLATIVEDTLIPIL